MKPLVITATPNICWLHPDVPYPQTVNEMVQEARLCGDAGAAILHLHAETHWSEAIRALRSSTELIVQCGM